MLETFKKEFIVFTDPDVEDLHFGALPAIGRYFTKACTKQSDGVFRVEIEAPKGYLYYHFYYDNNPMNVILDANNTQIGAKNWHSICKVGTDVMIPVAFFDRPPYMFALDDHFYGFKIVSSHKWIQNIELEVFQNGELVWASPLHRIFSKSGYSYFEQKFPKESLLQGDSFGFKVGGGNQTYYLGNYGALLKEPTVFYDVSVLSELESQTIGVNPAVYHIFPDRFAKSDAVATEKALQPWGALPTRESFFGGNLRGIETNLDHLRDLQVSQVYLTPIFQAASNHRYDCINYTTIDPLLGSKEDFASFVTQCHENGIQVILDIVLNHCGVDFFAFQDVLKHQENSRYRDWFLIHHFPVQIDAIPLSYRCWWNNPLMPEFNMENPEVRKHLLDACTYWVQEFGIDGWRIDVSSEMDIAFLEELRAELKSLRPDLVVIGENWKDASLFLDGSQSLDGTTNYLYWWKAFVPFFVDQRLQPSEFIFFIMDIYFTYSHSKILKSWNVLSSHDIPRFLSMLPNPDDIYAASFLQVTLPGTPVIYYGEEIGLEGLDDPLNRACMPWNESEHDHDLYQWYRTLLHLYRTEPALNHGYLAVPFVDDDRQLLIHTRYWDEETVICITNFSTEEQTIDIASLFGGSELDIIDLFTGQHLSAPLAVAPKRGHLLKMTNRASNTKE